MSDYNAKSNIVWGDIDLSEYDAFAFYCNIFDRPERDVSAISIPGRNGDLLFDNGRYKNIERVYQIQVTGLDNIKNLMSALIAQTGYYRLEDEYDTDVYMEARLKSPPVTKRFVGDAASITLTFDRKPQRYLKSGEQAILPVRFETSTSSGYNVMMFAAEFTINNTSGFISRPIINISGWPSTLEVGRFWIASSTNEADLDYYDISYERNNKVHLGGTHPLMVSDGNVPYVIVDCEEKTCTKDSGVAEDEKIWLNIGPDCYNDFPVLQTGTNYLRIVFCRYNGQGGSYDYYRNEINNNQQYWPKILPRWITL